MPAGRFAVYRLGAWLTCSDEWVSGREDEWSEDHLFLLLLLQAVVGQPAEHFRGQCGHLDGGTDASCHLPCTVVRAVSLPGELSLITWLGPSHHSLSSHLGLSFPSTCAVEFHSFAYVLIVCLPHQTTNSMRIRTTAYPEPITELAWHTVGAQ